MGEGWESVALLIESRSCADLCLLTDYETDDTRDRSDEKQQKYGLVSLNGDEWQTLLGMLATPFRAHRIPSL